MKSAGRAQHRHGLIMLYSTSTTCQLAGTAWCSEGQRALFLQLVSGTGKALKKRLSRICVCNRTGREFAGT